MALALGIELLLVVLLLSLGIGRPAREPETITFTSFDTSEPPAPAAEDEPQDQVAAASAPAASTALPRPDAANPLTPALPPPPTALPRPSEQPVPQPQPSPAASASPRIGAVVREGSNYGPANTGARGGEDSPVVGTAPDGSPLYAARWYREPTHNELTGYLSTANSVGWGLIACRTAPGWRVEDCEILGEYPQGSGIGRAVQAAAWQFQVRPARLGGTYQVGTWVRIRITYTRDRASAG